MRKVLSIGSYLFPAILGIFVAQFINIVLHPYWIIGDSMSPSYLDGECVICSKHFTQNDLRPDNVIIFERDNKPYIKRIAAVAGDRIFYDIDSSTIYIEHPANNKAQIYMGNVSDGGSLDVNGVVLRDGEFYCIGDNVNHSIDSRNLGAIQFDEIKMLVKQKIYDRGKEPSL